MEKRGEIMKRSLESGIIILSVFLAISFCVVFAEKETASKDKAKVTDPKNITNTANITNVLMNTTNMTKHQNITALQNISASNNVTLSGNATHPFANTTNPFAKARGFIKRE